MSVIILSLDKRSNKILMNFLLPPLKKKYHPLPPSLYGLKYAVNFRTTLHGFQYRKVHRKYSAAHLSGVRDW